MSFLLDTCAISEFTKRKQDSGLAEWLEHQPETALYISTITLGELERGIAAVRSDARRAQLRGFLEGDVIDRFRDRTLDTTAAVWRRWGVLTGTAERRGQPLPSVDALMACVAAVHGLTVVTRNVQDFSRCEVPFVNPWRVS